MRCSAVLCWCSTDHNGWHGRRHSPLQRLYGRPGAVLHADLALALLARQTHVGLEQSALQQHVLLVERSIARTDDVLSPVLTHRQRVLTVHQDLRLHYGHQAVRLADGSVLSERISVLLNSQWTGRILTNPQHSTPFSKSTTGLVIRITTLIQISQSLCVSLIIRTG